MDDFKPLFQLHKHHLLFDKYSKEEASCCDNCSQQIDEEWAFTCEKCNFWLHRSCALQQLPPKMLHPLHPQHDLDLYNDVSNCRYFMCNSCFSLTRGCIYRCKKCYYKFSLDLLCASSTSSYDIETFKKESKIKSSNDPGYKKIQHFSHRHDLTLFNYRKVEKDGCICRWCQKLLIPRTLIYGCFHFACSQNEVFFHESCLINIPTSISKHHSHPFHPLHLQRTDNLEHKPPHAISSCNVCGGHFIHEELYAYSCKKCKSYLHITCATFQPTIKHDPLHDHPLTYFRKKYYYTRIGSCRICEKELCGPMRLEIIAFYRCVKCKINFHFGCASIPSHIKHEYHMHELVLIDSFVEDDSGEYFCDICEKERKPKYQVYCCKSCRFVAHTGCALHKLIDTKSDHDLTCNLVDCKVMEQKEMKHGNANFTTHVNQIDHFDHEHFLSFDEIVEQNENHLCRACHLEIFGEAYGCKSCKYYLHKACTQFPNEVIRHPLHLQHSIKLITDSPMWPPLVCYKCRSCSKGFAYLCSFCGFLLHVKCADILSVSNYDQEQRLELTDISHRPSKLCPFNQAHKLDFINYEVMNPVSPLCGFCYQLLKGPCYKCFDCLVEFHEQCLGFPREIQLQFHSQHPLQICFGVKNIICPVCNRVPRLTSYSCERCDLYLHTHCALSLKRAVKSKCHKHNIYYFVSDAHVFSTERKTCSACKTWIIKPDHFYFCMECDTFLHFLCAQIPSPIKSKYHIHPFILRTQFKEDDSGEYYCDICEEERYPEDHVYYCNRCPGYIIAHPDCVLTSVEEDISTQEPSPSQAKRVDEVN